ncbi:MAG: hypothetical protein PHV34_13340 [Verrucomicrobiae bacterium]|nr:hypothetical protein [Verrucomicrobiae bacterium]
MIANDLLEILCCPETRQDVSPASAAVVEKINAAIAAGGVKNRGGQPVTEKIDGGLLRQDGQFLYPIREDIPIMLINEGLSMAQFGKA